MMQGFKSFIESQFPVSKLSKESYKERKAGSSQTLTGLGKWWGRKPLILVRANIMGLLMPASSDPKKDREVFLKILTMDNDGLLIRKDKRIPVARCADLATDFELRMYFDRLPSGKWNFIGSREQREEFEAVVFNRMGYDEKLTYCRRPEQVAGPSEQTWIEINQHLETKATNLAELIRELGIRQFGHVPRVGDAFCGGGSIPFEAARMGCEAFGSDLNPAAALLTWAAMNIVGGGPEVQQQVKEAQQEAFRLADEQITEWRVEHNEKGWRADAYLYCIEAKSPASGYWVPLAPSWVISEKYQVCAVLEPDHENQRYHINIVTGASATQMEQAKKGTIVDSDLVCPETGRHFSISSIRGDRRVDGETIYGLRQWENEDIVPRPGDTFQERLYCIRYIETYYEKIDRDGITELTLQEAEALADYKELLDSGALSLKTRRHFLAPDEHDLDREKKVLHLLLERFAQWQQAGFLPSKKIESGYNTDQPTRERGWTYWYQLFNPRQLLWLGLLNELSSNCSKVHSTFVALLLNVARCSNFNSKLCIWDGSPYKSGGWGAFVQTFTNQSLNTLFNFGNRAGRAMFETWQNDLYFFSLNKLNEIVTSDARDLNSFMDLWITDPPYADAINYHEVGDFFLAWYEKHLPKLFPGWYSENKAALAVKGSGTSFNQSMVDCYSNFTYLMPTNGAQVVMFTHQDSAVWADLALILWASGLQVTAAWTIQTETDAAGIKQGNYVQGTVCMVLRKQAGNEIGFLADIQADVEFEVRDELKRMTELEDKEDPNFSDTDYQLAAYVAALRVITGYKIIQDIDVRYELSRTRQPGEVSEIQKIIDSAVKVACDYLVPSGFDQSFWRSLSGEERFYIKSLEIQSHGEYRTGVFQELARGFGLRDYRSFLLSGKANETRMMTATEFGTKQLGDEGFGKSLVRYVLFAIRETNISGSPRDGRQWLFNELSDYWGSRQRIIKLLEYFRLICTHLDNWSDDVQAVELLAGYLQNDMAGA